MSEENNMEIQQNYIQTHQLMNQNINGVEKTEDEQELYEQQIIGQQMQQTLDQQMLHNQLINNQMGGNQLQQYYSAPASSLPPNYHQELNRHWQEQFKSIENTKAFKRHKLPLARIKKIMKSDEDVRMISAEAPILFAKACEMFIIELTIRSWIHTEEGKRRTLQRNDIASAISKTDIFDFLIDIVPRDDGKPTKKELQQGGRIINSQELASQQYLLYLAQQQALQQQNSEEHENNNEQQNNVNNNDGEQVYQIGNEMFKYSQFTDEQIQLIQQQQLQQQQQQQQQQHHLQQNSLEEQQILQQQLILQQQYQQQQQIQQQRKYNSQQKQKQNEEEEDDDEEGLEEDEDGDYEDKK